MSWSMARRCGLEVTGNRVSYVTNGKAHSAPVADGSGVPIATDPQSGTSYLDVDGHPG